MKVTGVLLLLFPPASPWRASTEYTPVGSVARRTDHMPPASMSAGTWRSGMPAAVAPS